MSESVVVRGASALKKRMGDGTSAVFAAHLITILTRFASNLILTRIVDPAAFGVVAILFSVQTILTMATDLAVLPFYVRKETLRQDTLSTLWTIKLIRDAALAVVVFVFADPIAALFGHAEAGNALRVFSVVMLLSALQSPALFDLARDRRLFRASLFQLITQVGTSLATVAFAVALKSYWAIVYGCIAGAAISLLLSYRMLKLGARPRFALDAETLSDLWKMARLTLPASLITLALSQIDRVYIGRNFPVAELGMYSLAMTIVMAVSTFTERYVNTVYLPTISQRRRDVPDALRRDAYVVRWRFTCAMFFALGGLSATGVLVARLLFPESYHNVGIYIAIGCIGPLADLLRSPSETVLYTSGAFRINLVGNLLRLVYVVGLGPFVFAHFEPIAVLYLLGSSALVPVPYYWWRLSRAGLLDLSWEARFVGAGALGFAIGTLGQEAIFALVDAGWLPRF
ncbi:MAG: oligosaccharide flippase family protein [Parvularculaceae bacterium]|nr:oligosaccharide flippase family protein [Parvularculaceae bacterium]